MDIQTILITIATSGIVSSLATLGVQTFLKQGITHHFNKELALFNAEITIQAEKRKLDFDRKVHDFSLYSSKRHEVYPAFFKQLYKIHHEFKLTKSILKTCKSYNGATEVISLFERYGFPLKDDKETIAELEKIYTEKFSTRRQDKLNSLLLVHITIYLDNSFITIKDFFMGNFIYFSDEATEKILALLDSLHFLIHFQLKTYSASKKDFVVHSSYSNIKGDELIEHLDKLVEEVKILLRKELSIGDYS